MSSFLSLMQNYLIWNFCFMTKIKWINNSVKYYRLANTRETRSISTGDSWPASSSVSDEAARARSASNPVGRLHAIDAREARRWGGGTSILLRFAWTREWVWFCFDFCICAYWFFFIFLFLILRGIWLHVNEIS